MMTSLVRKVAVVPPLLETESVQVKPPPTKGGLLASLVLSIVRLGLVTTIRLSGSSLSPEVSSDSSIVSLGSTSEERRVGTACRSRWSPDH